MTKGTNFSYITGADQGNCKFAYWVCAWPGILRVTILLVLNHEYFINFSPVFSHRHITWQVNSADGKVLDSGALKLPAADPDMLGITAWPLRLAEAINRSGGALKAGEMESGVITPLASSYRNHFWLPEGEKWQGATVRLTFLPSETADEKWRLNNRDDSALPVSLVTSEQSVLPEKMVLRALLVSAPQDVRDKLWKSKPRECVAACINSEVSEYSPLRIALCSTLRSLAKRWMALTEELNELDESLDKLTRKYASYLCR